ncbi:MAG: tRNA lysidine(34) synthetase TilS, partial [Burkholderiaceae bacterium]|nr:tRNA lysidine(34) synthetase TilS [Burkholderiaceae bacterium]
MAFERALQDARVCAVTGAMAVACSGGLDSMVLLHLAHDWALKNNIRLFAFHVHHGLSRMADNWLAHCRESCRQLGIAFDAMKVALDPDDAEGVEAAARRARYTALSEMCQRHGAGLLLTAHHEADQAETVLMQLMRGSGVAGLSGMAMFGALP